MSAPKISRPCAVLVEGLHVQQFVTALTKVMGRPDTFEAFDFGGINELGGYVRTFVKTPGFGRLDGLVIVRDNEDAPAKAQSKVRAALQAAGLAAPERPGKVAGKRPRVGYELLPGPGREGCLETLCLDAAKGDSDMACVEDFMECLNKVKKGRKGNRDKARAQAFLATRDRPGLPMGQAALAGLWPLNSQAFLRMKNLLNSVAGS